jgi:hypothetical protein
MSAEPFIAYDPPYGGQAIRAPNAAEAWARVSAFLETCTDALPSRPSSLQLALYESGGASNAAWLRHATVQTGLAFGPGVRRAWTSGAREDYLIEWRLAMEALPRALALLTAWEPLPAADFGPADLTIGFRFRWIRPETRTVLAGQDADLRAHPTQADSDLSVTLGRRSSAIRNARFPFEQPGPEFVAYLQGVLPRLPISLNPSRLRHWVPTKQGGGLGYRRCRLDLDTAKQ